jgi:microcystin-dependent protein
MNQTIGEIRSLAFGTTPPNDWLPCNGALLLITEYQALHSLIGTSYGGDGETTFGLPNLNGRVMVGCDGSGGAYAPGTEGGDTSVMLQEGQEAPHNHNFSVAESSYLGALSAATNMPGDDSLLCNTVFVSGEPSQLLDSFNNTETTLQISLNPGSITPTAGGAPHDNRQPYFTVNYCIATMGAYPIINNK